MRARAIAAIGLAGVAAWIAVAIADAPAPAAEAQSAAQDPPGMDAGVPVPPLDLDAGVIDDEGGRPLDFDAGFQPQPLGVRGAQR